MARPSNRQAVIDAVLRVAETQGLASVTIDSVAAEAGMTKGGLLYHFHNRSALISAVYQYLADSWEAEMVTALGRPPSGASPTDRLKAYVQVSSRPMSRAELVFLADADGSPELSEPWRAVMRTWAPSTGLPSVGEATASWEPTTEHIVRLAADGLWSHDALTGVRLSEEVRQKLADAIAEMVESNPTRDVSGLP